MASRNSLAKHYFDFGKGRHFGKRLNDREKYFRQFGEVEEWNRREVKQATRIKVRGKWRTWSKEDTSLKETEKSLGFPLQKVVHTMSQGVKDFVAVDWGCGSGKAITTLAEKNPQIHAYGYSHNSYTDWLKNNKAKFIFGSAKRFKRYFKENSINLLYSDFGVMHLGKNAKEYLLDALPCLKKGGIFVSGINWELFPHGEREVTIGGMVFKVKVQPWCYLDRGQKVWHHDTIIARRIK